MGTLCSGHRGLLQSVWNNNSNVDCEFGKWKVAGSPLVLLADNASAVLNEVVVCEHQEVSESSGACPCSCGSGNEVLQGSVKSEGGKQMFLFHFETSWIVWICEQEGGGGLRSERVEMGKNLPWSLSLSTTSSQAFCRLSTICWYSLRMFSACNKIADYNNNSPLQNNPLFYMSSPFMLFVAPLKQCTSKINTICLLKLWQVLIHYFMSLAEIIRSKIYWKAKVTKWYLPSVVITRITDCLCKNEYW